MGLYTASPGGSAAAAVVIIQEAFGVNDHIREVADRLAGEGYLAVAPALFHRTGAPELAYEDGFQQVLEHFKPLSDAGLLSDVDAALGHIEGLGIAAEQTAIVGFCMGGRVSFLVAIERRLGAAVGMYGGGIVSARYPQFPALVDRVPELKTPWLGLFGDTDRSIPIKDVETLRARLEVDRPAGIDAEVVRYAGAGHGFFCDKRKSYRPEAADDAWSRTLAWFRAHGVSPG